MRRDKGARDLDARIDRLAYWHRVRSQPVSQGLAFEQLHDGVDDPARPIEIVQTDDVRVRQRGDGSGFTFEASEPVGIVRDRLWKDFDGDVTAETSVTGAVDLAHPAGADGGEDFVGTKSRALAQRHRQNPGWARRLTSFQCSWGPTPTRCLASARRLARLGGRQALMPPDP